MDKHQSDAHLDGHVEHHIVPIPTYLIIFGVLIVGTIATVLVALVNLDHILFAGANTVMALLIAFVKTSAVVLWFMHVKYSSRLIMMTVIAGFVWLAIMFALTMQDFLTRTTGTFSN